MVSPNTKILLSNTAALRPYLQEGSGAVSLQNPLPSTPQSVLSISVLSSREKPFCPPVTRSCMTIIQYLLIFRGYLDVHIHFMLIIILYNLIMLAYQSVMVLPYHHHLFSHEICDIWSFFYLIDKVQKIIHM